MHATILAFALFGSLLGIASWWLWRQRQIAREQARINEDLATLGRAVQAMGHDLNALFGIVLGNLSAIMEDTDDEVRSALEDVRQATSSARRLVAGMRLQAASGTELPLQSASGVLQLLVSLVRRNGIDVRCQIEGEPRSEGPQLAAFRLFQNLLANAERAVRAAEDGTITVRMSSEEVRVSNRVLDVRALDDVLEGRGAPSGSGMGLGIARDAAERLGWTLRHEVDGDTVSFIVDARSAPDRALPALVSARPAR